ncbi:efflux RND transporter periplasmic adaptor subunit [bacterium]|nr:MAG: efflux RND transporter periplasmic adaptor subunit [bacterium]
MKRIVAVVVLLAVILGLAWPKIRPLMIREVPVEAAAAGKPSTAGARKGDGQLRVTTVTVAPRPFVETITATGTLRAEEGVELQAETNGKIVAINFDEGAAVRRGTLLVKLNDADLRASLDRYVYGTQLAEARMQRFSTLRAQQVVTQQDYDTALGDLNVQKANVDLYKAQIEKTEIRAPFDGVVGLRYVSNGAYVNAATRIATLQRVDKLKVDFAVPERYSGRARVGSAISFSVAGGLKRFTGRIYAIDPRIDTGTRTILLRAVCDNVDGSLLPGAFANVNLPLDQVADALLIPAEAVVPGLEEKNVFVMKDGHAERRAVETGARTATEVHILTGLAPGDVVITSGLQNLRQGQAVALLATAAEEPKRQVVAGK